MTINFNPTGTSSVVYEQDQGSYIGSDWHGGKRVTPLNENDSPPNRPLIIRNFDNNAIGRNRTFQNHMEVWSTAIRSNPAFFGSGIYVIPLIFSMAVTAAFAPKH